MTEKEVVSTKWLEDMSFESEINGHKLILDAKAEFGGQDKGPRPKPLMLAALGGCTSMDVVLSTSPIASSLIINILNVIGT